MTTADDSMDAAPAAFIRRPLGVGARILGAVAIALAFAVSVGIFGVVQSAGLASSAAKIYNRGTVPLSEVQQLQNLITTYKVAQARSLVNTTPQEQKSQRDLMASNGVAIVAQEQSIDPAALAPGARTAFADYLAKSASFRTTLAGVGDVVKRGTQPRSPLTSRRCRT